MFFISLPVATQTQTAEAFHRKARNWFQVFGDLSLIFGRGVESENLGFRYRFQESSRQQIGG